MASAITNQNSSYQISVGETSAQRENPNTISWGKYILGFGLGLGMFLVYGPITERIVKALGCSLDDPFNEMHIIEKIVLIPVVCILCPIGEEKLFRGSPYDLLKEKLQSYYSSLFSEGVANVIARITTVFFSAVIFGLSHFMNALLSWRSPVLFLPQVIAATIMGIIFALAKEISRGLEVPIGMHIGNNTLAWSAMMLSEFYV